MSSFHKICRFYVIIIIWRTIYFTSIYIFKPVRSTSFYVFNFELFRINKQHRKFCVGFLYYKLKIQMLLLRMQY